MNSKVRARTPWLALGVIFLVVGTTIGGAAANMMPFHWPTTHEIQQQEQADVAAARRALLQALAASGDHCRPAIAREIARAMVYGGQSAKAYADDYAKRCDDDDAIVAQWGAYEFPDPLAKVRGNVQIKLR